MTPKQREAMQMAYKVLSNMEQHYEHLWRVNESPELLDNICLSLREALAEPKMLDKNGTEIKAGDTLFNPHDRDQYHTILQDADGRLYLGDLDSPLERYAPQKWWEVVHQNKE